MRYTLTFRDKDYDKLVSELLSDRSTEKAAYLLCGLSITESETRLLVREVIPVKNSEIESASPTHLSIRSSSYARAIKRARETDQCFVFVHSHPEGFPKHSTQDDIQEAMFFKTVYERVAAPKIHASLVISDSNKPVARVWLDNNDTVPISLIRVIGKRFRFYGSDTETNAFPEFFDRQIRAFGEDIQKTLAALRIGIVGTGGTGSAVAEQLIRLGVGTLYTFDGDTFQKTNVNRVYGSRVSDEGMPKVDIVRRHADEIGLGTKIMSFDKSIVYRSVAEKLRNCDIIFGCTDDEWGRSILCSLSNHYYIPIFDMGVQIDSLDGDIRGIHGRVTYLFPDEACLFCRSRISSESISSEIVETVNPNEAARRRQEGYIPELPDTAPSVIPFTTATAATAVIELLHRLTGFMGERHTNEAVQLFDQTRTRGNARKRSDECGMCDPKHFGKGDQELFLGQRWIHEA